MKNLLYIGNHLQNSQSNPTFSAVLGPLLERSGYEMQYASRKSNKVLRLLDMVWITFKTRQTTEVVLIDTYSTQNFYYAVVVSTLCRGLKLPYIPILHGGNLGERLKNSPILSRKLFGQAKVNVSPSQYMKKKFAAFGVDNVLHIPNTISLKQYPFLKRHFDLPRLLWVRSFSEIYNPMLAVLVLQELKARGIDAQLCMVGPDSDGSLAKVKTLASELEVSVRFTGKLSKAAWTTVSKDYNVFINTTNLDNMPVSVMEAMALGLPVVSTNVGGLPYLVEHGLEGFLVPPNHKQAMADAIMSVFESVEHTEAMVARARKKVEELDWEQVRGQWDEVLRPLGEAY